MINLISYVLDCAHRSKIVSPFHSRFVLLRICRDRSVCVNKFMFWIFQLYLLWQHGLVVVHVHRRINIILLDRYFWLSVIYLLLYSWHIVELRGYWGCGFRGVSFQGPLDACLFLPGRSFFRFLSVESTHPSIRKLLHLWLKHHLPEAFLIRFVA